MKVDDLKARIATAGEKPVLLFYGSLACGPTLHMFSVLAEFEETMGDNVEVITIEVEKSPDATKEFGIRNTPTFVLFHYGEAKGNLVGTMNNESLLAWLAEKLAPKAEKKKQKKKELANAA